MAPLLALILADGKSLVLSVVPKALVEMSRSRMRGTYFNLLVLLYVLCLPYHCMRVETFASIMTKRIYTLDFDRSTKV